MHILFYPNEERNPRVRYGLTYFIQVPNNYESNFYLVCEIEPRNILNTNYYSLQRGSENIILCNHVIRYTWCVIESRSFTQAQHFQYSLYIYVSYDNKNIVPIQLIDGVILNGASFDIFS